MIDLRVQRRSHWEIWIYVIVCHLFLESYEKMADIDINSFW